MTLHTWEELEQGTEEWLQARVGVVTASVVGQLITMKTLKPAANDTARMLTATLAAERITGHVEPMPVSRDMERGTLDEPFARDIYAAHHAPVDEVGFMVREWHDLRLGYSPDGLVGDDGLIEIKSRRQKKHLATILAGEVPAENMAQIQAGMLVSGREWCDYISYCGGMPLWTQRVTPDPEWRAAILEALRGFEESAGHMIARYQKRTVHCPPTERIDHFLDEEISI